MIQGRPRSVVGFAFMCVAALSSSAVVASLPEKAEAQTKVLTVQIMAGENGAMASLALNGEVLQPPQDGKRTVFDVLQARVRMRVEANSQGWKAEDFEAIFECDPKLKYTHVIQAMRAVSGYQVESPDGARIVPLISKLKFKGLGPKQEELQNQR